jgi:hypothetical protein
LSTAFVEELLPPVDQPKQDESMIPKVRLKGFEYLSSEAPPHLREPPS